MFSAALAGAFILNAESDGYASRKAEEPAGKGAEISDKTKDGVYVQAVQEGGASDGKLEVNDRLVSIGGNVVQTTQALSDLLAEYAPGDTVTVAVVRNGKLVSVEVRLAENANTQE